MPFRHFRNFPIKRIEKLKLPLLGRLPETLYRLVDYKGVLSDFFADPQRLYEWAWPHAAMRLWLTGRPLPSVSVVVATHNNERTIERSLRSLLNQKGCNLEVIVVDDASSDRSPDILERMSRADERIKLIRNDRKLGTGASRNRGLLAANGKYLTFQDGDDLSLPGRLRLQVEALEAKRSCKLALCNYARVDENGRRLAINNNRIMKCIISMMFPREEVLRKVGYFMNSSLSEDSDFYQRIKIEFGPESEVLVFRTLYEALFRPDSSFFSTVDILSQSSGEIRYQKPSSFAARDRALAERHQQMRRGQLSTFVPMH